MVRHTGIKDWQCNMCPRSFYFQRDLKAHLMQHEGTKKFQCPLCTSTFSTSSALKKHGKIHSDERNFECDKCSLRFRNKGVLEVHYRTHTGEVTELISLLQKHKLKQNIFILETIRLYALRNALYTEKFAPKTSEVAP